MKLTNEVGFHKRRKLALSNHGNFYITPSGQRKNVLRVEDLIKYTTDNNGDLTYDLSPCLKVGVS